MLFHSISWACNQNQAVCSSQPTCSIQLLSVAKFIKIAQECALKPSPCGCSPAFLQRHQVHEDPGRVVCRGRVCAAMRAGPGTTSTSAFPEHLGKCQNSCPWHRPLESSSAALAIALTATGSSREREEQTRYTPARKSAGCFSFMMFHMQQILQLRLGCFLDGDLLISLDFTKVWHLVLHPVSRGKI